MGFNHRKLLSEKRFLRVQERARKLQGSGTDLIGIYYKDSELVFKTRSGTDRRIIWTQHLVLANVTPEAVLMAKDFKTVEEMIKNTDLKISCDCQAFHYWGYKYMAWRRGYGLIKETRRPKVRNRNQEGFLCKHLYLVVQIYPFWAKSLASKFRNRAEQTAGIKK